MFNAGKAREEGGVVEVAFHAVGGVFELHALEGGAFFVFGGAFGGGLDVGVVVPEEAALHDVCEGVPLRLVEGVEGRFGIVFVY